MSHLALDEPDDGKASIACAAFVYSEGRQTFTAEQFSKFLAMWNVILDPEGANEFLSDMADKGQLREIGPGVYAKPKGDAP